MAEKKNINISSLDFDGNKQALKEYLRSLDQFTDIDFEGSGISQLLDLLAANTYKYGFYLNAALGEAFIDTAVTRDAVVSHAKTLGYTPRSRSAARAIVDINFGTNRPTYTSTNGQQAPLVELPVASIFTATQNQETFVFSSSKPSPILLENDGVWYARNVELREGQIRTYSYVVEPGNRNQRFTIPSQNVDTTTLQVRVQESAESTTGSSVVWQKATNIGNINPDDPVYFLQETNKNRYEIYFGDGVIGRAVEAGNLVSIQYLSTNGRSANGVGSTDTTGRRTFLFERYPNAEVIVISRAQGGADPETVDSIRQNAPAGFAAQNRAVTAQDFKSVLSQSYGDIESVNVWGGEDANPPQYGRVFISIKPRDGRTISDDEKASITRDIIKTRSIVGVIPEIVDPDFLYLLINSTVTYDRTKTSKSPEDMSQIVRLTIEDFADNDLEKFDRSLRFSKFIRRIDDSDQAITGNQTSIELQRRLEPVVNVPNSYSITFDNPIYHPFDGYQSPVVRSESFSYTDPNTGNAVRSFLQDNGSGVMQIYKVVDGSRQIVVNNIGTVKYTTGTINLVSFAPLSVASTDGVLRVTIQPANQDVISKTNTILTLDTNDTRALIVAARGNDEVNTTSQSSATAFPFATPNIS